MLYKIKLAKKIFLLVLLFQITSIVTLFADNREQNNDKITYLLLEAQRLEQTHNPDSLVAAFEMLKAAIKDDNLNQDARFKLSSYYYKMNMPDKYYDNILLAAYSDTTNYYYNIVAADNAQKIGDYEIATEIYERLIRNYPNDESLYTMMANLYLEQADIEKAIECYNKVERLTDNTEYAAFARADVYLYLKQYDKAASEFKRLLKNDSTNITSLLSLSQIYIQIDSLTQAKNYINKAKDAGAGCEISLYDLEYYKAQNNNDSAKISMFQVLSCPDIVYSAKKEILREYISGILGNNEKLNSSYEELQADLKNTDSLFKYLIEENPRETFIKMLYAEVLQIQQRYSEAIEQCHSALYISPSDMDIHRQLIRMLAYSKNYEAMNIAVENASEYADSTFVLESSAYYYSTQQVEKAISELNSAAQKYSSPLFLSQIYSTIADIYFNEEEKELPEKYYKLSLEYNPDNTMTLNNYAYYLAQTGGDLSLAENMSARTIKEKPDDPTYLDTYAWIYFKQGKYLFAELYIKKAMDKGGRNNPEVVEHYGDILYHQGKVEDALVQWQEALEMNKALGNDKEILKQKIEQKTYIKE